LLGNGGAFGHALQIRWGIDTVSNFSFAQANGSSATVWGGPSASTYALNTWYHLAVSKDASNNIKCFINGVEEVPLRQTAMTSTIASGNSLLVNSKNDNTGKGNGTSGYTSNVRWIKGTALYTASFTPPTSPLDVIANTSLLACHDTSFKDGSVNNFTITTSGTPSISTVTPFVVSTKSVQFNGSNNLQTPSDAAFAFGTGDWTIDCWIRTATSNAMKIWRFSDNSDNLDVDLGYSTFGGLGYYNGSSSTYSSAGIITSSIWYHIAAVRKSGTVTVYLNGNAVINQSSTPNSSTRYLNVGGAAGSTFNGYISNFRVVKGTALYTASFTALAEPLTSIASCSLLTCNAPTIVDSSNNNFTITNNGSATVSSVTPFNAVGYGYKFNNVNNNKTSSVTNNSVLFNGTNQYLTLTGQNLSTGNFTIEGWVYITATGTNGHIFNFGTNNSNRYMVWISNTGKFNIGACVGGTYTLNDSTFTPSINTWYHVAYVRSGGTSYLYVNGTQVGTNSAAIDSGTAWCIGTQNYGPAAGDYWKGYISNFRVVKGTALYTSSFTPPTSPLTAIANTQLLTCNAPTIVDSSTNNFTITNNNGATVSSTVTPFAVLTAPSGMNFKKVYPDPIVVYLTQKAIFGYGNSGGVVSMTNLVSNTGVVATDTTGVGTARDLLAAAGYGTDKSIFGYGGNSLSITNLVSNTGVVSTNTTGVGTGRYGLAAAGYGTDKAIFGYGFNGNTTTYYSLTNHVSNTGVVSTDAAGVGTARWGVAAASYGSDKSIFGYGRISGANVSVTNLVSNTGIVASDTTGVGTIRFALAAAGYGTDKAIFGYGDSGSGRYSMTNLVSNTGVVATDTTGVGTARSYLAAAGYGTDKAIFGYGSNGATSYSMTNKVSNTGIVASDTTGVGTIRDSLAAAGYSLT
jgi:hypothetical protein